MTHTRLSFGKNERQIAITERNEEPSCSDGPVRDKLPLVV